MAKENDASSMEIDDQKSTVPDQINPKYSINVLQFLKSAQMHGLRFGDYACYRAYCSRRLTVLYKSLEHKRPKYTKITASTVTEVGFLHVVLFSAEKAWSCAMEERQLPNGPNERQRKRKRLIGRLKKAVKWATLFAELCAIKGDSRTSLEAEAYASYMRGNLLFEQDRNWDIALKCFKKARAVYEELGKYGDVNNQNLCRERVEEVEPSIRHCLHKIGESNLQASELVQIGEMEGPALDLFKAKLEAVMAEARSQQAASMTEFHWLGHRFPISNAKTRVSILKAQELEKDLHGQMLDSLPAEKSLAFYDKIFAAYHEARSCIHSDLATTGNSENMKDDLSGLDKAIGAVLNQRAIERNQLLVSIAKSKLNKVCEDKNEKVTEPEELVRLYDLLLQNTADLFYLVSSGRDRKPEEVAVANECEVKSMIFQAERCFFLGKSYSLAGKRTEATEAYSLYCRTCSLAETALEKLQNLGTTDQALVKELKTLCNDCRRNNCLEHAMGIMEDQKAPDDLSRHISTTSIAGNEKKLEKFLVEKLDVYESAMGDSNTEAVPRIEAFPPAFQAIPCNPILEDVAYNSINSPSLENRMKKKQKGILGQVLERIKMW